MLRRPWPRISINPVKERGPKSFSTARGTRKEQGGVPCFAQEILVKFASARVEHPYTSLYIYSCNGIGARRAIAYGGVLRAVRARANERSTRRAVDDRIDCDEKNYFFLSGWYYS